MVIQLIITTVGEILRRYILVIQLVITNVGKVLHRYILLCNILTSSIAQDTILKARNYKSFIYIYTLFQNNLLQNLSIF